MSASGATPGLKAQFAGGLRRFQSSQAAVGAFWVVLGSGAGQGIRLLSNIVLAYLLAPEIFGIMALAYTVIVGLGQVSDVGLREGVVNSKRIDDPAFMRTAWTLQVLRGAFMAAMAAIIAVPFARFYGSEVLAPVVMMIALSIFISGFKSISLLAYDKRLELKTQILSDLGVQTSSIAVVIAWAWWSPTVWALIAGQVFGSVMEVALSYLLFKGHHSRFAWDRSAVRELFHFGKWIVLSSTISFITVQGDRLIMKLWMTMGELGLYSIASNWAGLVSLVSINLSLRVLHPFFRSSLEQQADFAKIHRTRLLLNALYACICLFIAVTGQYIVDFIYDDRYLDIGWMLQVLAVGQIGRSFTVTLRPFLTARGDSFSQMTISAISAAILVLFILVGGWLGGTPGVVIAYAMSGLAMHPVMVVFAGKHGYHCMRADMGLALLATAIAVIVWWLTDAPIMQVLAGLGGAA